jgi:phosphoglycolate phosphatase-like HAD superfamily hydrolase
VSSGSPETKEATMRGNSELSFGAPCVAFDLDGTLLRSEPLVRQVLADAAEDQGLELGFEGESPVHLLGMTSEDFYRGALRPEDSDRWEDLRLAARDRYAVYMETRAELYEGVEGTLTALRTRGYRLLVCTNAGERYVRAALDATGISDRFERIWWNPDGLTPKSTVLGRAVRETGCGSSIMVGDRLMDMDAARAVGARAIGARYGYGLEHELEGADAIIDSAPELLDLLDGGTLE